MSSDSFDKSLDADLLWKRIASDDLKAFRKLFDHFYDDLVAFSHRFTQQQTISEEIAQDIFVSLWERRKEITIESSLKSYLYRSVRNRTINYLKNQLPREQKTSDIDNIAYMTVETTEPSETEELLNSINFAIARLPEKCRVIFLLSRNEGLTHKEIATELDVSVKTVENQIGIALKKLRESLKPYLNTLATLLFIKIVFVIF